MTDDTRPELTVIVPAHNERSTIGDVIRRLLSLDVDLEIIVVDDGSTDGTAESVSQLLTGRLKLLRHDKNRGKGAAIRTALPHARGRYVVVQDADLEYDPHDLIPMLEKMRAGARVVYGNRQHPGNPRYSYRRYLWGGLLVTFVARLLFGLRIHDEPVCYKMFRLEDLRALQVRAQGFEFCPEVTAKAARLGWQIEEVPVSYNPRSFEEGKKISWRDGVRAIAELIYWRLVPVRRWYRGEGRNGSPAR